MTHYTDLDSQKYYLQKTKAEIKMHRKHNVFQVIKMFVLSAIIVGGFTLACLALIQSPDVVLNAVEALKAQNLWPL